MPGAMYVKVAVKVHAAVSLTPRQLHFPHLFELAPKLIRALSLLSTRVLCLVALKTMLVPLPVIILALCS